MSDPRPLRVAVIGVGHLGSRHAERLAASPRFELIGLHDRDQERAREVAGRLGTEALTQDQALERAEAAVVATSTPAHFEAAAAVLAAGKHALVEKPLTADPGEARTLVSRAGEAGLVLHVGHVERMNPALRGVWGTLPAPLFVESHRLAPLVPRNLDIDVVQDLMVHDLDLALAFIGEEPSSVDAVGIPVLTGRVDIANARLRFPGGAVANLTASRVSLSRVRKFRMFLPGAYLSADCAEGKGELFRLRDGAPAAALPAAGAGALDMSRFLDRVTLRDPGPDALTAEHEAFRLAVLGEPNRGVTGREALRTLDALVRIEGAIEEGLRERR